MLSLIFELLLIATEYGSTVFDVTEWVLFLLYFIRYLNMFIMSMIAYYLIRCPKLDTDDKLSFFINYFWGFMCIFHIIWICICIIINLIIDPFKNALFYQNIYFYGLYVYIIIGMIVILIILIKIKQKTQKALAKLDDMGHANYSDYVYSDNDDDQPDDEQNNNNNNTAPITKQNTDDGHLTVTVHTEPNKMIKEVSNDMTSTFAKIAQLTDTKYKVNIAISLLILLFFVMIFLIHWNIVDNLKNPNNNYTQISLQNCIIIILIYIVLTIYNWVSLKNISINSCIFCPIKRQQSLSVVNQLNIKSNSVGLDTNKANISMSRREKSNGIIADNRAIDKTPPKKRVSFAITEHARKKEPNGTTRLDRKPSGTNDRLDFRNTDSIVSYTDVTRAELSRTHLNTSLVNINSRGEILGKRGAKKPVKLKDRKYTPSSYDHDVNIKLELNDFASLTDNTRYDGDDAADALSLYSQTTNNTLKLEHFVEDVLDTMSMTETNQQPINTIVFEFGDVICTQINKLSNMGPTALNQKSLIHKQLFFGGGERIKMINYWLDDLKQSDKKNDLKYFINTEQETKLVISLLKDVDLLKPFVSRNIDNPNKLISHIIGWDHKISKDTDRRKHLILLELLQFLHRSHCELLYVSHDKEIVQHLNNIQICKTYLCEQKGLTQNDLDTIQGMYF